MVHQEVRSELDLERVVQFVVKREVVQFIEDHLSDLEEVFLVAFIESLHEQFA